jgi:hypothetical protein
LGVTRTDKQVEEALKSPFELATKTAAGPITAT